MHFSNHLDSATGPPLRLQTMLGWRNTFKTGTVFRGAQTTTLLGGEGKGGKIKVDRVNYPKNFVLHFWFSNVSFLSIGYSGILQSTDSKFLMWGITWFWSYLGKYVQFLNNYWDCWQQCRVTVQWREGIVWANCSYISDSISNIIDVWLVHDYFCSLYWCLSYDMNLSTVICWHLAFWNAST